MGLAYGPVLSRRLGRSLGINPLGDTKICSFDCTYCDLGPTEIKMNQLKTYEKFPKLDDIEEAVREALREQSHDEPVDWLTFAGHGEPTLYPEFPEAIERILQVRDELAPNAKVTVLSNGAHLESRKMISAMNRLDERMIKVDAGNEAVLKIINNPLIRAGLQKVISGSRSLDDCIVQSLFIKGDDEVANSMDRYIEDWMEVVGIIKPKAVHLYTLRYVPSQPNLMPADEDLLYTIASKLKRRTMIEASVFI